MSSAGKGGSGRGEDLLGKTINQLAAETTPIRGELSNQFLEALRTGGVGAQIPIIGAAQSASREATSRALTGTEEQLTAAGLARTPFAARTMAQTRLSGETATSMIPTDIARAFIGAAPGFSMAPVGAMISGAGTLGSIGAQRDIGKGNQQVQLLSALASSAAMAGACWIARRLYGNTSSFALARWWIFVGWRGVVADAARWAYLRYGERISRWPGVGLLRPLFDVAVRRGAQALA